MDTPGTQALPVVPLDGSAATFFAEARPPAEALTRRETDVLALLAQGRGNRSIADELRISTTTVKTHLSSMLAKLDARSRCHAVALAAAPAPQRPPAPSDRRHLTTREIDVLRSLRQGRCNKRIANDLQVGVGTVKTHLRSISRKLNAASRIEAMQIAVREGWV